MIALAIYAVFVANSEIEIEDVVAVSISDSQYKHRYSGKNDIEEYVSLILDSKDDVLQEVKDETNLFTIEFEMKNGSIKTYEFYPSASGECLLKDGTGTIRVAKDISSLLLRTEYKKIYKSRHLPDVSVSTADGVVNVLPSEYAWNFRKTGKEFYPYTEDEVSSSAPIFNISADALKKGVVSFSAQPDEMLIAYSKGGDLYSNVENLSAKDGDVIEITVSALWKNFDDRMFFGEGKWKFQAIYRESAVITLNKSDAVLGECLVLYVENVDAGERISLSTDIVTCKNPIVYKGDNRNYALVPIDVKTTGGEYPLDVSYKDSKFQFKIKVTAVSNGFVIKNIPAEIYNSVISPDGIKDYEDFLAALDGKSSDEFLWDLKKLSAPVDSVAEITFASEVLYNGLPPQVYFEGESYAVPQKTSVKSAAKGKVVFAGETTRTGKAVVIDHGHGIMTHYYHLSVISALEGEEIEGGKLIALSGKSGYTDKEDLYFAVSINGVFVNPNLFYTIE
jgi:hypothetical protein